MSEAVIVVVLFLKHYMCELTGGTIGICLTAANTVSSAPHTMSVLGFAVLGSAAGWFVKAILDRAIDPVIEKYFPKKK